MPQPPVQDPKPFTVRVAFVVFLALVVGVSAGFLFFTDVHSVGLAILTAVARSPGGWSF